MFNLGSNPTFREKFPPCAENILCYFLMANLKQIWSASVCTCPWHISSYHLHRLSWLWNPGAGPRLVLLCKWRSRISFLWKVKQAKKRLRSDLIQSKSFCIFPCGPWCANFPVISTVKLLFRSILFEVDCRSVKVFRVEFLTLKHPI